MLKNKDTILNSLKTYAASPQTKQLVRTYIAAANPQTMSTKILPPVEVRAAQQMPSSVKRAGRQTTSKPPPTVPAVKDTPHSLFNYNSYFTPPEQLVSKTLSSMQCYVVVVFVIIIVVVVVV